MIDWADWIGPVLAGLPLAVYWQLGYEPAVVVGLVVVAVMVGIVAELQ
jgi:hypothetical protein